MDAPDLADLADPAYPDALPDGPARRRGAGVNPANRFQPLRLHVLGDEIDRRLAERAADGLGDVQPRADVRVYADRSRSVINRVAATSDVPFDWTLNPYRGCEHGCVYCYARPFHEYLGFSCGLDFETAIVAKPDAPALLRRELADPRWAAEPIVMSAITDVYQPIEHRLRITRRCLEVLAEARQPTATMTKGAPVLRDLDLWQELARHGAGRVTVTFVTLDDALAKSLEPRAASPARRLAVIRELSRAGVPVSANVAPVIPGLTDHEVPSILRAVAEAGATRAHWVMLRLPWQLKSVFLDWLARSVHPARARRVESMIRQSSGGKLYDPASPARRRGRGPLAEQVGQAFAVFSKKYGLDRPRESLNRAAFRRPVLEGSQMALFD